MSTTPWGASGGISANTTTSTWTSFANDCTRWIWENKATANGGFNDPALIAIAQGYGMTVEQCLENAQRFGANNEIWSGDASTGTKEGCWLRPYRKSTKNIWLRATVYLIDGSAGTSDDSNQR